MILAWNFYHIRLFVFLKTLKSTKIKYCILIKIELQSVAQGCSTWQNLENIPTVVFYKGKHRNRALTSVGIVQGVFNLRRVGVRRQMRRAGGVALEHLSNSAPEPHSDTQ